MNAVTLKDLDDENASSGNGLLSVVQMLAMSLGVAASGALLSIFADSYGHPSGVQSLPVFHGTFICIGLITAASAFIFWQLTPDLRPTRLELEQIVAH